MRELWVLLGACAVHPAPPAFVQPAALERRELGRMSPDEQRALLMDLGKRVYETGDGEIPCATCHGADGAGTPGAMPPLAVEGAWWADCAAGGALVREGRFGDLTVEGQAYRGVMMPYGDRYNDLQVAAVISYARFLAAARAGQPAPPVCPTAR